MLSRSLQLQLFLILVIILPAYSLDIDPQFQRENLSRQMYIFPDSSSVYNIASFYAQKDQLKFKTTNQENFVENFGSEYYWLYIPVHFDSQEALETILEIINPDLNEIQCYVYRDQKLVFESKLSGDRYKFETREIEYKHFIFPIDFDPSSKQYEIILKINSAGESFICPIRLSEKSFFYKRSNLINFGSGLYYCLLVLFIISLLIFYSVSKESMILYYVGYLSMLVLYLLDIDGLTNQYMFSKYPFIQSLEQPILAGLLAFFFLKFSNKFFNFKKENPILFKLITWASWIILVCIILMPFILNLPGTQQKIVLFSYLLILLISSVSIYLLVAIRSFKFREAKYYLFAITFGIEAIGFCIHFSATHAFIPDLAFTRNILFYASLVSLSFFTIYLIFIIDKINSNYKALQIQLTEQKDKAFRNIMVGENVERARISSILEEKIAKKLRKVSERLQRNQFKPVDTSTSVQLKQIQDDLALALENLESVNLNMAPSLLNKEGFQKTVERDISMVALAYPQIHFDCVIDEIESLGFSEFDTSVIYRIFEETLNNALKHAQASIIEIHILVEDDALMYRIKDNGIGFLDPKGDFTGIGMKNIESRVGYLNGRFKLKSIPGNGTTIKVNITAKKGIIKKIA